MKTFTTLSAALLIGCAPLVSKDQQTLLSYRFVDNVVAACPTTEPLGHRAVVIHVVKKHAQADSPEAMLRELSTACPDLTDKQRIGYDTLLEGAWIQYSQDYWTIAQMERARRAAHVQSAGRTMMEIQRTDDLNRIRRNQEAFD